MKSPHNHVYVQSTEQLTKEIQTIECIDECRNKSLINFIFSSGCYTKNRVIKQPQKTAREDMAEDIYPCYLSKYKEY